MRDLREAFFCLKLDLADEESLHELRKLRKFRENSENRENWAKICAQMHFGLLGRVDIAYCSSTKCFQQWATWPADEGSFTSQKNTFLNDSECQKGGLLASFLSSVCGIDFLLPGDSKKRFQRSTVLPCWTRLLCSRSSRVLRGSDKSDVEPVDTVPRYSSQRQLSSSWYC